MDELKDPDMQPANSFETRTTLTSLGDDNIIYAVMKKGADENLQDAQANVAACRQLANGRRLPILCDYRQIRKQSREAQIYYANDEVSNTYSACAILVENPVSKMVANFFLGLRKPKTPTRLFTDEKMALAWLREYR